MSDEQHDSTAEPYERFGSVKLMEWWHTPGGQVLHLRGMIKLVSDEDQVGFRARGANSANWLAVIEGKTETWNVFGCQIRAIIEHGEDVTIPDTHTIP